MKNISFSLVLITASFLSLCAQQITGSSLSGAATQNVGWSDTFSGSINGTPSILKLRLSGNQLEGSIDAGGYIYNIKGTINDMQSQGTVKDIKTGGTMNYIANLKGNNLSMNLIVENQFGELSQVPLQFTRGERGQSDPSMGTKPSGAGQNVQRDQNLVGGWRHTESYTSGEFSMVSEWYMNIYKNGSYTYGDGQVAGGDDGYSFDSGQDGSSSRGEWKTENAIIYINEGAGWQPYAGYYVAGNSLMFKFNDGSKQLWERFR